MDKLILEKKIDSILRSLTRIAERLPESEDEFLKDYDAQDVVVLNLTRAVQMCVDLATHILSSTNQPVASTMAEAFVNLEHSKIITPKIADKMKKSVGYRNIAVHNYDDIDLSITYDIARNHLNDFKDYIKEWELNNLHILTCFFIRLRPCSNSYVACYAPVATRRRPTKNLRDNAQLI